MSEEAEAGEALAEAVLAGGEEARVAAKVILEELCPDKRDPCECEHKQGGRALCGVWGSVRMQCSLQPTACAAPSAS